MPDRLAQLRRQRALAQEQLDWLNREIATAEASKAPPASARTSSAEESTLGLAPPAAGSPALSTEATTTAEEDIIARYRVGSDTLKKDVKKGCVMYFFAALLLLGALVVILYFSLRSR
jgi:cobalamin biosynthesis Mg chelatase CobN